MADDTANKLDPAPLAPVAPAPQAAVKDPATGLARDPSTGLVRDPLPVEQTGTGNEPLQASDIAKILTGSNQIPANFPGYPKIKYHPVHGAITVNSPNEEAALQPPRDFLDTPGEADLHRTDREAQQVIAHNLNVKIGAKLEGRPIDLNNPAERGGAGVVRNSVQATESLNATRNEPL